MAVCPPNLRVAAGCAGRRAGHGPRGTQGMAGGAEPNPQADLLVRCPGGPPLWFPPLRGPVLSPGVPFCHFDPLSSPRVPFCPIGKGSGTQGEGGDMGTGRGHRDREGTWGQGGDTGAVPAASCLTTLPSSPCCWSTGWRSCPSTAASPQVLRGEGRSEGLGMGFLGGSWPHPVPLPPPQVSP